MRMRDSQLATQNRLVGALTLVVGVLTITVLPLVLPTLMGDTGRPLYTLTNDVDGIQTGSIVVLNGHEIGQVTDVTVEGTGTGGGAPALDAAQPVFRVAFTVDETVRLPTGTTRLRVAQPNPVALARLVVVQVDPTAPEPAAALADLDEACAASLGAVQAAPPPPACPPARGDTFGNGDCLPMAATDELPTDGLDGLVLQANALLCEMRGTRARLDVALAGVDDTLAAFEKVGTGLAEMVDSARPTLDSALPRYEALPDRLDASLDKLDSALDSMETTVSEAIPDRLDHFRTDIVARADRLLDPETLASLTRAVQDLEVLVAESSRQSFQVMQNLTAATRNLNEIARELRRDPAGFLFRDRGGSSQ